MELYAKGQLSFLMLTCLQERDFYGLDIISEISNRSNKRINLKKPSVYSNLTRMEKQGYITSYLQSSDFGPNRKYYSLTESGRHFYQELKDYFDRNNIDVFREFVDSDSPISNQPEVITEINQTTPEVETCDKEENNDFFDFSSIDNINESKIDTKFENTEDENNTLLQETEVKPSDDYRYIENTSNDSSHNPTIKIENNISEKFESTLPKQSNQVDASIDEYNRRLYDISKDINKYKRKRSFAEDQIAMTATAPLNDSQEKTKANIEYFKSSFLENKNKYQGERLNYLDFSRYSNNRTIIDDAKTKKEELKNDAVFITQRITTSDLEKPKKIEPPRLKINTTEQIKETKLPAPKRDVSIDPSHKEILTKLYSKSKDSTTAEVREDALYDFDDLKDYYKNQNIAFNEYKKSADKNEHNTNKLYLWVSLISFALSASLSAILFLILFKTNLIYSKTTFLYILLPSLLTIDLIWKFYNFRKYKGWLPSQILPQWQIWALFMLITGLIVCLNFICGMSSTNFVFYATTTILPIVLSFVLIPARYYIKRILLIKFWK